MAVIAGFPYFELQFTKDAKPFKPEEMRAVLDAVRAGEIDELFVVSHGWNNDMAEARTLYRSLFHSVRAALDQGRASALAGRRIPVLGVLWPSKRFAEDDLIPGGGASVGGQIQDARLQAQLDDLKGTFDRPDEAALEQAKQLVPELGRSPRAQREFVDLIRSVLPPPDDAGDDASDRFFALPGDEVMRLLEPPIRPRRRGTAEGGGASMGLATSPAAAGGAADMGDLFRGIGAAARRVLNFATYYQMKERAGRIGAEGLNPLLGEIRAIDPHLRVHLVGHSFGGRLVTAAAMGRGGSEPVSPASLTLLQAAFSHNGFAANFDRGRDGFFREVLTARKVAGPIVITHTRNDRAVGIAYPIASRFARQDAADLGDEDDIFGGIGRNGALVRVTPEAVAGELLDASGAYTFTAGKLHNLKADRWISGHSDVTGPEVANVILAAASSR
jgi:hypothetical protein